MAIVIFAWNGLKSYVPALPMLPLHFGTWPVPHEVMLARRSLSGWQVVAPSSATVRIEVPTLQVLVTRRCR